MVHSEDVNDNTAMEFKQIPHSKGHDQNENSRHDEEDGYSMDVPDD
jgi:hypothetical protein